MLESVAVPADAVGVANPVTRRARMAATRRKR
jgi:hypothetical protein